MFHQVPLETLDHEVHQEMQANALLNAGKLWIKQMPSTTTGRKETKKDHNILSFKMFQDNFFK